CLHDHVPCPPVVPDGRQLRRGSVVVVPEIVVDHLKVPDALTGARVQSEQRRTEEVGTVAIGAVVVVRGRTGRYERDAALDVDRDFAPGIGPTRVLVRV